MHTNSKLAFEQLILPLIPHGCKVMDVGAPRGNRGHKQQLLAIDCDYWYSDLSNIGHRKKITWIDEDHLDCPDSTFDIVVSAQTLEHVRRPWIWVKELARVIKVGGLLCLISPVTWAEHRHPVDCWRILPDGGKTLLEEAGMEVVLCQLFAAPEGTIDAVYQFVRFGPVIDLVCIGRKHATHQV